LGNIKFGNINLGLSKGKQEKDSFPFDKPGEKYSSFLCLEILI
jgi:hypothetical protein